MERAIEVFPRGGPARDDAAASVQKDFKRPQLNRWIDDNYTLIGKGHFYKGDLAKAEEVFKYLQRKHKEPDSQVAAGAWLARTYMAMENMPKANSALLKAVGERDASDELRADAFLVQAEFLLTQNNIEEAMRYIERMFKIKPKRERRSPSCWPNSSASTGATAKPSTLREGQVEDPTRWSSRPACSRPWRLTVGRGTAWRSRSCSSTCWRRTRMRTTATRSTTPWPRSNSRS